MLILQNKGPETLRMVFGVDASIEGCRLSPNQETVTELPVGDQLCMTKFEPGATYRFEEV